jgi:hypothetical protein
VGVKEVISRWLLEESYTISNLEGVSVPGVEWGLAVSTQAPPGVKFSVISPSDKRDRVILVLGVVISPEHRRELEKLSVNERVRLLHTILSKALMVCSDCKIAVKPAISDPQAIVINLEVFNDEIEKYGKSYFLRTLYRLINTYLAVVSGFNEWFPVVVSEKQQYYPYM